VDRVGRRADFVCFLRRYQNLAILLASLVVAAAMFWVLPALEGEHMSPGFEPVWWLGGIFAVIGMRVVVSEVADLLESRRLSAPGRITRLPRLRRRRASLRGGLAAGLALVAVALALTFSGGHHERAHPSALSLRVTPLRVRSHGVMAWGGSVVGSSTPLELLAREEGSGWRTFAAVPADHGRYTYEYRFRRVMQPTTYSFRVSLPGDATRHIPSIASNEVSVLVE
jgi:hypothetical protein